jgi:hypothetical protein
MIISLPGVFKVAIWRRVLLAPSTVSDATIAKYSQAHLAVSVRCWLIFEGILKKDCLLSTWADGN